MGVVAAVEVCHMETMLAPIEIWQASIIAALPVLLSFKAVSET